MYILLLYYYQNDSLVVHMDRASVSRIGTDFAPDCS